MRRRLGVRTRVRAAAGSVFVAAFGLANGASAVEPHRSMATLSSSNGLGAVVYDATAYKITEFLEHPYQAQNATTTSRNFAYDSYPGLRVGSTGTWLDTVAPTLIEYLPGTGIIHTQRTLSGLGVDEYHFAPMGLVANASVMLVHVTENGGTLPVDVYSLFNYQVGSGNPPAMTGETATYDASRDAFYLSGGSGIAMAFASIPTSTHHGSTPNNPYGLLTSGSNLMDDAGSGGAVTSAVEGFQTSLGTASGWAGWVTVLAADANGAGAVDKVRTWLAGRTADKVLSDEQAGWAAWITPPPAGASTLEAALDQTSQAILRMGQVTETGASSGQILAAVTPGEWNISWVRDMAYSTVALVKSHHYAEAKAALAFQMNATVGGYQPYTAGTAGGAGVPYQISLCRYYGDGSEWSDSNANGPNIEYDGFGLFLWALDQYVTASGDTAALTTWWPTIKAKVADVLVHLQEPSGLISPDSSIWEVHWSGQQRHFTYTTASAANGLCSASRLATKAGDTASATTYLTQGKQARDAMIQSLRAPGGVLAQSTEAIASGMQWLDASTIEAINWGLIDPKGHTADASRSAMLAGLVPPSGRGFMRDQNGQYYDSQEWVFVDLRSARAFGLGGDTTFATSLFTWNTDQAAENFNELSELHDATNANYAGAAPMVGFGSGAYLIALEDRGTTITPTCGAFAVEPAVAGDGGVEASVDAGFPALEGGTREGGARDAGAGAKDGAASHDGGSTGHVDGASPFDAGLGGRGVDGGVVVGDAGTAGSSGGCAVTRRDDRGAWPFLLALFGVGILVRRKRS